MSGESRNLRSSRGLGDAEVVGAACFLAVSEETGMFIHICDLRKTFCHQQGQSKDPVCPNKAQRSCRKDPIPLLSGFGMPLCSLVVEKRMPWSSDSVLCF